MKHQKTIEQEVINFIKKNDLISDENKILVGFSGGADSVFALHFFKKYSKKYKIKIAAVHVNHNLRGKESERDEKFCRNLCEKLDIDFYSSQVDVSLFAEQNKKSIEEAARILRYGEFEKVAGISNSDLIVTSHNNDDNTETVLLNIVNGSGLNGISGIPRKRGNIIRPFLCLQKIDILGYLNENKIKFVEDSSNKNLDFRRNYLRNKIIPELKKNINPSIDKVVLNSSEVFRNQIKIIDYYINGIVDQIVKWSENKLSIPVSELKKYPDEVLGELFKSILITNFSFDFSYVQFEKLKSLINSQVGIKVELGKMIFAYRDRSKIVIFNDDKILLIEKQIEIGETIQIDKSFLSVERVKTVPQNFNNVGSLEFISGDNIEEKIIVRRWKKGDRIQLLGMKGTKKISDVLTDLKIPSYDRKKQLVLVNKNEIIWIVGKKISEKYKITSKTKSVLKICLS
jgi:tRNA(Ile)-lysidine synthase